MCSVLFRDAAVVALCTTAAGGVAILVVSLG